MTVIPANDPRLDYLEELDSGDYDAYQTIKGSRTKNAKDVGTGSMSVDCSEIEVSEDSDETEL